MLAINIPADGLFLAVQNKADGNYTADNCERIVCDYIDRFLAADPDIILLNVCYRRALTPSDVIDSYLYDIETDENGLALRDGSGASIKTLSPTTAEVSKYFISFFLTARELLKNGIDIYQFAVKRIRQAGCRVLLSVRMNDVHYTDHRAVNSSFAFKNGCRHTVDRDGVYLDFSQEAVRNYYCAYIEELLSTYPVDGIELDWLRYPNVLPTRYCDDTDILRSYMKRIHELIAHHNEDAFLAVRVLATETENLSRGFDACGWIADGSVSILTIENFYIPTNFELPVPQWRQHIEERNVLRNPYHLLCGSDWAVSCVKGYSLAMNPALVRGFADTCLESGADGVYLFNFFEEDDTSALEIVAQEDGSAILKSCFSERIKAAKHPDELPRRYVHIGNTNKRYPILLDRRDKYAFTKTLNQPFDKLKVIIGCDLDAPLSVSVNGQAAEALQKEPVYPGFAYLPAVQRSKDAPFIYAVTQAAPTVKSVYFPNTQTEKGSYTISIQNNSAHSIEILWLEIECR